MSDPRDREAARRVAALAMVIRETYPELAAGAAAEVARRLAERAEAERPDPIKALLAEFEAMGMGPSHSHDGGLAGKTGGRWPADGPTAPGTPAA